MLGSGLHKGGIAISEFITTITQYIPKQMQNERGAYTLHKFVDINNTEMVARSDVANLVRGYMNQPLKVTVRSEQKGQWLNHYLDHAEPVANGAAVAQQAQQQYALQPNTIGGMGQPALNQGSPPPQPVQQPVQQQPQLSQGQLPHQMDQAKDQAIHRQVAAKVAAKISTTSQEFWANVLDLAYYFDTGQTPSRPSPQQYQNPMGAPPPGDEDIPFSPTIDGFQ